MGFDGAAGMAEDTAAVALLKNPLTLSRRGICCSATAIAGRARRRVDEKRIVAGCGEGVLRAGGLMVRSGTAALSWDVR